MKSKKRFLALLLTLAMVLSIMPMIALPASANPLTGRNWDINDTDGITFPAGPFATMVTEGIAAFNAQNLIAEPAAAISGSGDVIISGDWLATKLTAKNQTVIIASRNEGGDVVNSITITAIDPTGDAVIQAGKLTHTAINNIGVSVPLAGVTEAIVRNRVVAVAQTIVDDEFTVSATTEGTWARTGETLAGTWYGTLVVTGAGDATASAVIASTNPIAVTLTDISTFTISGTVLGKLFDGASDTPSPLAGATVTLQEENDEPIWVDVAGKSVAATAAGIFSFTGIEAGDYRILVTRDGYTQSIEAVTVTDANITGRTITLTELDPDAIFAKALEAMRGGLIAPARLRDEAAVAAWLKSTLEGRVSGMTVTLATMPIDDSLTGAALTAAANQKPAFNGEDGGIDFEEEEHFIEADFSMSIPVGVGRTLTPRPTNAVRTAVEEEIDFSITLLGIGLSNSRNVEITGEVAQGAIAGGESVKLNLTTETMVWPMKDVVAIENFVPTATRRAEGGFMESRANANDAWERETEQAFTPTFISVDGGERWRAVRPNTFQNRNGMMTLLNKGGTIHLTDAPALDRTTKKPVADMGDGVEANAEATPPVVASPATATTIITFAPINARPRAARLTINYLPHADATGATAGRWTLIERGVTLVANTNALPAAAITTLGLFEITLPTGDRGRLNPAGESWGSIGSEGVNGIAVFELEGPTARVARQPYFIRQRAAMPGEITGAPALSFTPASKPARIQASSELRAPKAINVRNNRPTATVNFRAGSVIEFSVLNGTIANTTLNTARRFAERTAIEFRAAHSNSEFVIWTAATERRPASAKSAVTKIGVIPAS
jgi:hypothetical protein